MSTSSRQTRKHLSLSFTQTTHPAEKPRTLAGPSFRIIVGHSVDVKAFGLAHGLGRSEIEHLLALFGTVASKRELLANMRAPSRIR